MITHIKNYLQQKTNYISYIICTFAVNKTLITMKKLFIADGTPIKKGQLLMIIE
jgi:hypothetical protein